ncbi:MSCRAMM family protein [Paludibaculum fermentans]|uniref:Carboxypeptidase regulatory-like domain-containing protein n=1 Tax=Paludibaculum fermentans TaxID=1473598 RepID=A0A7S7NRA1_PALFE|nr:carboxypeptidase-like regulatory domain-containing protein [Paludibaculum fermentans]QOY88338.1 carboxypeptidase regulatory-like domain-containing protein [Paludibaculum fermentans]
MRVMSLCRIVLFWSFSANFFLFGQTSNAEKFTLSGSVLNSATGEPVKRALLTLSPIYQGQALAPRELTPSPVFSDPGGAFSFAGLSAGRYRITAQKPQYRQDPEAGTIELGPSRANFEVKLDPLATLEGTVLDTAGNPIQAVSVQLIQASVLSGRRTFRVDRSVSTDDRGRYRLWNLQPGSYYVRLSGRAGGTRTFMGENAPLVDWPQVVAPIYHGRAVDRASATPLVLGLGQRATIDFNEPLKPAFKVKGLLTNFVPHAKTVVQLLTPDGQPVSARVAVNEINGRVEVNDVTTGDYLLRATQGEGDGRLQAEADVRVSASHVEGVELQLQRGIEIQVSLNCDQDNQARDRVPCRGSMELRSAGESNYAVSDGGGRLKFRNVNPGVYSWRATSFGGYVAAASIGAEALTPGSTIHVRAGLQPEKVELVVRSDGGVIEGEISPGIRQPSLGILAVPNFESLSGPTEGQSLPDGRFFVQPLAPGDYTVYAHPRLREIPYLEPEALRNLTNGFRVTVTSKGRSEVKITAVSE